MKKPEWAAELIGDMFREDVSQTELAQKLGLSRPYFNMVLSGKKKAPDGAPERYRRAFEEILEARRA